MITKFVDEEFVDEEFLSVLDHDAENEGDQVFGERRVDNFRKGELMLAQLRLLESGENSDLQITCQGRVWNVHRGIVAQRCEFLRAAIRPEFQVHLDKPIELDADDPEAIDELLKYLYTLSDHIKVRPLTRGRWEIYLLPDEVKYLEELPKEVKHLTGILVVANKYLVSDLVMLVDSKIKQRLLWFQDRAARIEKKEAANLVSQLTEALYPREEIPTLQKHQSLFVVTITRQYSMASSGSQMKDLIQNHPKLGSDLVERLDALLQEKDETIQDQGRQIQNMRAELPKSKRKRFE